MDFNNHDTDWEVILKALRHRDATISTDKALDTWLISFMRERTDLSMDRRRHIGKRIISGKLWKEAKKPFYNIWPCMSEALSNTSLKIPCSYVSECISKLAKEHGLSSICIRWPKGHELMGVVGSCLINARPVFSHDVVENTWREDNNKAFWGKYIEFLRDGNVPIELIVRSQKIEIEEGRPIYLDYTFPLQNELTIEGVNGEIKGADKASCKELEVVRKIFKTVCAVYLMVMGDTELITPVVTKADREKYELSNDDKFVKRARKRGVVGWDIGKNIEFSPHVRRPHFAVRWTGKMRKIPKIVPIKGCIVRRNKLTEVPTGYLEK